MASESKRRIARVPHLSGDSQAPSCKVRFANRATLIAVRTTIAPSLRHGSQLSFSDQSSPLFSSSSRSCRLQARSGNLLFSSLDEMGVHAKPAVIPGSFAYCTGRGTRLASYSAKSPGSTDERVNGQTWCFRLSHAPCLILVTDRVGDPGRKWGVRSMRNPSILRWIVRTSVAVLAITILSTLGAAVFGLLYGALAWLLHAERAPVGFAWLIASGAIAGFLMGSLWAMDRIVNWRFYLLPDQAPRSVPSSLNGKVLRQTTREERLKRSVETETPATESLVLPSPTPPRWSRKI